MERDSRFDGMFGMCEMECAAERIASLCRISERIERLENAVNRLGRQMQDR